jgi:hypothetical protein
MMHNERIINALISLCEAFGRTASEVTIGAYEIGLAGLTAEQIEQATAMALRTKKFMPVPAELRELAASSGACYENMAERAFLALQRAVQRLGPDYSVNFHDGAINVVVRLLGGWIHICEQPREEFQKWFRRDFVATYVRVCRDGVNEDLRRYHGGRLERDNAAWHARTLPSGHVFRLGDFSTHVHAIEADYKPALPAPIPKTLLPFDDADRPRLQLRRA